MNEKTFFLIDGALKFEMERGGGISLCSLLYLTRCSLVKVEEIPHTHAQVQVDN